MRKCGKHMLFIMNSTYHLVALAANIIFLRMPHHWIGKTARDIQFSFLDTISPGNRFMTNADSDHRRLNTHMNRECIHKATFFNNNLETQNHYIPIIV